MTHTAIVVNRNSAVLFVVVFIVDIEPGSTLIIWVDITLVAGRVTLL